MEIDQGALSAALAQRTRSALRPDELTAALAAVTETVVELELADCAGITERVGRGRFRTLAATDPLVGIVDALQYEFDEGPCVEAVYEDGLLVSQDVGVDPRWPRWGPKAAADGVSGVISVHLYTTGSAMGALNLYTQGSRVYSTDDLDAAKLAGAHASIALAHYRTDSNLWRSIESRHRIGQAQGILMERFQIDAERAFTVLRRLSQHHNRKLHLIADEIVSTRQLPVPPQPPEQPPAADATAATAAVDGPRPRTDSSSC